VLVRGLCILFALCEFVCKCAFLPLPEGSELDQQSYVRGVGFPLTSFNKKGKKNEVKDVDGVTTKLRKW
jgi:hypothetical protein